MCYMYKRRVSFQNNSCRYMGNIADTALNSIQSSKIKRKYVIVLLIRLFIFTKTFTGPRWLVVTYP